jgi:hypothetical protein
MHSNFSSDSDAGMRAMCESAIQKGIPEIGFSEHFDLYPQDQSLFYRPEDWWQEVERIRKHFEGRLVLRAGVEIGEPHRFPDEVNSLLNRYPYDFVSIALTMLVQNEITVIDLDPQVISLIQEVAHERSLRIKTQIVDICKPLPPHFIAAFDVIVTDPIYFITDMMNFLSAAEQCLSLTTGATLLSCCARALAGPAWRTVDDWAASRNLVVEKVLDGFNEYPKPARTQALLSLGERLLCRTPLTRACATIPDAYSDLVIFRRIERGRLQ